jgi:hypothetical protein
MPQGAAVGAAIGGSLLGSWLASSGAQSAAETQAGAAESAAGQMRQATQYYADQLMQAQQEAARLQELQYLQGLQQYQPYQEVGAGALLTLKDLLQPGGYLAEAAPTFQFDVSQVAQEPGYDFALQEGLKALERSAAARGTLLTGGTGKALERYGTDYATSKINDVYNRNLSQYQTNIGTEQMNRVNLFNRIASLAGVGQQATGATTGMGSQLASSIGSGLTGTASNVANLGMSGTSAAQDYLTSAAAANASGNLASSNIWANTLSSLPINSLMLYDLMKK